MRTSRTNGVVSYDYIYNGGSLSQLTVTNELDVSTVVMNFAYDAAGKPMTLSFNGAQYFYVTNLQGDVTAILNASGGKVVEYTYDAWGNVLSVTGTMAATLGQYNPLRYRGYVYDRETGLYYLQSRYYNPETGRFINADVYVSTGQGLTGNNMFAYCRNNPVRRIDAFGLANTPKGATGSAIMFSLIQIAIENGLDPYKYLTWLLKQAKDADLTDVETVQSLLPWNASTTCAAKDIHQR